MDEKNSYDTWVVRESQITKTDCPLIVWYNCLGKARVGSLTAVLFFQTILVLFKTLQQWLLLFPRTCQLQARVLQVEAISVMMTSVNSTRIWAHQSQNGRSKRHQSSKRDLKPFQASILSHAWQDFQLSSSSRSSATWITLTPPVLVSQTGNVILSIALSTALRCLLTHAVVDPTQWSELGKLWEGIRALIAALIVASSSNISNLGCQRNLSTAKWRWSSDQKQQMAPRTLVIVANHLSPTVSFANPIKY